MKKFNNKNTRRTPRKNRKTTIYRNPSLAEMRYIDTIITNSSLTGGQLSLLNMPSYGTGPSTRISDCIKVLKIEMILTYHNEGATSNYMRFALFRLHGYQPTPTLSNFFINGTSGAIDPTSLYLSYANGQLFSVVWDRLGTSCPNGDSDIVKVRKSWSKRLTVPFVSGFAVPLNNSLVFAAISDSVVIPSPKYEVNFRIWYIN